MNIDADVGFIIFELIVIFAPLTAVAYTIHVTYVREDVPEEEDE